MSKESNGSGGIGFSGLLTIAFIVLKLTGFIGWSWWWVLSPFWITGGIAFTFTVWALSKDKGRRRGS